MMFARFGEIFREHPWWIVGGVVALVILIWLMMRGGSSGQMAVYSSGPTDAQVQGAYALQAAQIAANAQVSTAQLANEKSANDNAAAITLNAQNTGAATTINAQNTGAATAINSQNATAAVQINGQNVVGATNIAAIGADAAKYITQSNNNLQSDIAAYNHDAIIQGMQFDFAKNNANLSFIQSMYDNNAKKISGASVGGVAVASK